MTINNLCLFVPIFIPSAETRALLNESTKNHYTSTFDSWYTDSKRIIDGLENQVDKGSALNVNSSKYLIPAN